MLARRAAVSLPDSSSSLVRALYTYDHALTTAPYRTKAVTSLCVSATGDAMAQQLSSADGSFDAMRTARQAAWGLMQAPVTHNVFNFLARLPAVGVVPASVVGVAVDQVCISPPVHAGYFAWVSAASSGFRRSLAEIQTDVSEKLWPAWKAGLAVWPATIYLNVRFVPLKYRVLFTNVVGVGYGMLMSTMAYGGSSREEDAP